MRVNVDSRFRGGDKSGSILEQMVESLNWLLDYHTENKLQDKSDLVHIDYNKLELDFINVIKLQILLSIRRLLTDTISP